MPADPPCRVVLISSCDRLADIACAGLFDRDGGTELVGVVQTSVKTKTRRRIMQTARREGAFFYIVYMFAEMTLPRLRRKGAPQPLLSLAGELGVPMRTTSGVNDAETIGWMRDLAPDAVLSVRPGVIFRQPLIDASPPILNLHGSMLPEFRGIAGVLQALAAGRDTLGCSVHLVSDEQVDRGDIAAQSRLARVPGRSVYYHTLELYRCGPATLRVALRATLSGEAPTPNQGGSYFSWPSRSTLRELRAHGHRLIQLRDVLA